MAASGSRFRATLPIDVGRLSTALVTAGHISTVLGNRASTFLQGRRFFCGGAGSGGEEGSWVGRVRVVANALDMEGVGW